MNHNKYKWVLTKNKKNSHNHLCFQFINDLQVIINNNTDYCVFNWQNSWQIEEVFDLLNSKILAEIKEITKNHQGYYTLIKIEDDFKASADIFTIDPIKYKISEKIKKSFDPKRIFNPGKMYTGI